MFPYDDRTGLYLVRNRVYHPLLGRWLQQDPLGYVDGTNLYQYCLSDPANLIDPTGEIVPLVAGMLAIGIPALLAAHYGAHEMTQAVNEMDEARYMRGQNWFAGGVAGVGTAISLPLEALAFSGTAAAFGTTAAGTSTFLGTGGSVAFVGSISSGIIGGGISGAFSGAVTSFGFGGSIAESAWAGGIGGLQGGFYGGIGGSVGGGVLWRVGGSLGGTMLSGFAGGAVAGAFQGLIETGTLNGAAENALWRGAFGGLSAGVGWGIGRAGGWIRPLGNYPDAAVGRLPRRIYVRTRRPSRSRAWMAPRTRLQRLVTRSIPGTPPQAARRLAYNAAALGTDQFTVPQGMTPHHALPQSLGGPHRAFNIRMIPTAIHRAHGHPSGIVKRDPAGIIYYRSWIW